MEKVTITEIKPVNGMRFEAVTFSDGRTGNVWDGNNGSKDLANSIRQNLNLECEAELKQFTKKDGSIGYNVRAFMPLNITPQAGEVLPPASQIEEMMHEDKPATSSIRDTSIIAQCMVKAVFSQPCNFSTDVRTIKDAVGMYKEAVKLLNE